MNKLLQVKYLHLFSDFTSTLIINLSKKKKKKEQLFCKFWFVSFRRPLKGSRFPRVRVAGVVYNGHVLDTTEIGHCVLRWGIREKTWESQPGFTNLLCRLMLRAIFSVPYHHCLQSLGAQRDFIDFTNERRFLFLILFIVREGLS